MKEDILILWFSESPDAGHPECICSYCYEVIEDLAIKAWNEVNLLGQPTVLEGRFHEDCANKIGFFKGQILQHYALLVEDVPRFLNNQEKIVAQTLLRYKVDPIPKEQKEEKRTSEQWLKECAEKFCLTIYHYDGWDQDNLQFSFKEELITKKEFIERVGRSPHSYFSNVRVDFFRWKNDLP
jgi:hypothetical protein